MMRTRDWIRFYTFIPLAGAVLAGASLLQALLVVALYLDLIGYAFVVNNYFDVEIDRQHPGKMESGKNPLASGVVSYRGVQALMALQIGLALLSYAVSPVGAGLVAANIVLVTAYSMSGIRLKERIGLDIVTHGLMFGMVPFLAGYALVQGGVSGEAVAVSLPLFLLACEALLAHQIVDYSQDLNATRTTVTVIGQRNGMLVIGVLGVASAVAMIGIGQMNILPYWMAAAAGWYLLAYPVYSCRGIFHDIRSRASLE